MVSDSPGGLTVPISPQANRVCPALKMFTAAVMSASVAWPQLTQMKSAWVMRFSLAVWPHIGHLRDVFFRLTNTTIPFAQSILYSSCRWNSPHPASRILRFNPDLCWTFLLGLSMLPFAVLLIALTCRSSRTIRLWLFGYCVDLKIATKRKSHIPVLSEWNFTALPDKFAKATEYWEKVIFFLMKIIYDIFIKKNW